MSRRIEHMEPYLCRPAAKVREAMERINGVPELFQLIVDDGGRLQGTLTDGDVRRAILRGVELGSPVSECMNRNAVVGHASADSNAGKLADAGGMVPFLPVVDADGRLVEVLVAPSGQPSMGMALLMAGGFGRRLGEITRTTPKPLIAVGGRPIISHLLDRLEGAGVSEIVIAVHYLAEQFSAFLADRNGRAKISLVREDRPRGTAGAIAMLPRIPSEPFLVANADVMTKVDFAAMRTFHDRHSYDATVAVAQYEVTIPYGVVVHSDDGLLISIEEKPKVTRAVAAGIYLMSPEFCALVPADEAIDMPTLLNRGRASGLRIGLFPVHEYWRDIGRPADLAAAHDEHYADGREVTR